MTDGMERVRQKQQRINCVSDRGVEHVWKGCVFYRVFSLPQCFWPTLGAQIDARGKPGRLALVGSPNQGEQSPEQGLPILGLTPPFQPSTAHTSRP